MGRVLVVDDDELIVQLIEHCLKPDHVVESVGTLAEARSIFSGVPYDLYVVDIMLPDGDGFELLQDLQASEKTRQSPVIILSIRSETPSQVMGISLGADDYIVKPFDPMVFKAKVDSKIKKFKSLKDSPKNTYVGNLRIAPLEQRVYLFENDQETTLELTNLEYKILFFLSEPIDQVRSREALIERVWGKDMSIGDRTVDTHISHLRRKMKGSGLSIESIRGRGYRLTAANS